MRLVCHILMLVVLCLCIHSWHFKVNELLTATDSDARLYVPSGQMVKLVSLGFDRLVADFYWLGFVQYVGDVDARRKDRSPLAYRYLDLIIELDPTFIQAYWFAAFVLGGDQKNPNLADELLKRGLQANPDTWYMPFIAATNQYLYARNEQAAAKYYRIAAKYAGAPGWLERQALVLEAKIPSYIKEINVWTNVYDGTDEPRVKEHARDKLIVLWINVYKTSPTDSIRSKAIQELNRLGVMDLPGKPKG